MDVASIFIAGCGEIGTRVADLALQRSLKVTALVRNVEKKDKLQQSGIETVIGNLDSPETLPHLDLHGAAVCYLVPPPGGGIKDTRVMNFLASIKEQPAKVVYISTTAVYGDCGDELVTEERPVSPANHTAKRRCDAEDSFRTWGKERGVPVVILRVSGIYGPGRIPMQRILSNEPLLNEMEAGYTNRIHAADLAQICLAAIERGEDGDIFNICDGETSKMTDYFNAITDLLNIPRLPQVSLDEAREVMSPLMFSYMTESRKISNNKMIEKLGIKLQYPTMKEGLKASF